MYKSNQELVAPKKRLEEKQKALGVDHSETLSTVNEIGRLRVGYDRWQQGCAYGGEFFAGAGEHDRLHQHMGVP